MTSDSGSHASSFDEKDDQDWGDWVDDVDDQDGDLKFANSWQNSSKIIYHALFLDKNDAASQLKEFDTATEAIAHTESLGCNLLEVIKRCRLDPLQIIRLLNHLRRQVVSPSTSGHLDPKAVNDLKGDEPFLNDDKELVPVEGYEQDGLLQVDFDELSAEMHQGEKSNADESRRIAELQSQLQATQLAFEDLRKRLIDQSGLGQPLREGQEEARYNGKGKGKALQSDNVDDDSHYFTSYASHDIHQTMLSDKVRTLSYGKFLMSPENAHLIRGKTVMDVGCGSGILSLFAARAGAKEVIAIDASDVANRAKENIRVNGMDGIITVYKGKVEDLQDQLSQFKGRVDIIVSEWMGYFLLYESMLPSVLYARDVYLRKGGILAPSHTRMLLAAVADCSVISDRLQFWDNVHGFSMQAMKVGLVDEAWTDTLQSKQVVSSVETLFELPLQTMTAKQPSFTTPFALKVEQSCSVQAFASWFDTWFTPDGLPMPQAGKKDMIGGEKLDGLPPVTTRCPKEEEVRGLNLQKDAIISRETDSKDSKGEIVSFTTGPDGLETHWRQTFFVLKEPIEVEKGEHTPSRSNVCSADSPL
jgi:protein arginine N-methyltransferase 3